ncbi:MAG: hypothetical protein QNJ45_25620 [Ardenticatenaceae bacterium]|nr:hypothetical protein [Ardenticatenaceae bacterium]
MTDQSLRELIYKWKHDDVGVAHKINTACELLTNEKFGPLSDEQRTLVDLIIKANQTIGENWRQRLAGLEGNDG